MVEINYKPNVYEKLVNTLETFVEKAQKRGKIKNIEGVDFKGISIEQDQYQEKFQVDTTYFTLSELTKFKRTLEDPCSKINIDLEHADVQFPFTNEDLFDEEDLKKKVENSKVPPRRYKGYGLHGEWINYKSEINMIKITNKNLTSIGKAYPN